MATPTLFGFAILMVVVAIPTTIGIALIVKSRGKGLGYPACGSCKYDVSASVGATDRCPECGLLFVTAGIVPPRGHRQPILMWMGVTLLCFSLSCAGMGLMSAVLSQRAFVRARTAAANAAAAQQQALQQQQSADSQSASDSQEQKPSSSSESE